MTEIVKKHNLYELEQEFQDSVQARLSHVAERDRKQESTDLIRGAFYAAAAEIASEMLAAGFSKQAIVVISRAVGRQLDAKNGFKIDRQARGHRLVSERAAKNLREFVGLKLVLGA